MVGFTQELVISGGEATGCPLQRSWVGTCVRLGVALTRKVQLLSGVRLQLSVSVSITSVTELSQFSCVKILHVTALEGETGG